MSSIFSDDSSFSRNFVVCILLSIVLLFVDYSSSWLSTPRTIISWIKPVVEYPAFAPGQVFDWLSEQMKSRQELLRENARLRAQALIMQKRIQHFASLTAENIRLRELLESSSRVSDSVLVAEIVAEDSDPYSHKVILNKGKQDGVFVGMPIIDANGLMGQIVFVSQFSSRGLLVTDLQHGMSVEVIRNGVRAIAKGSGSLDEINLSFVSNTTDIQSGDILVSSGLGGRFPQGYPVGIVKSIERQPGRQFANVSVTPLARLDRSRHVLLVFKEGAQWQNLSDKPVAEGVLE